MVSIKLEEFYIHPAILISIAGIAIILILTIVLLYKKNKNVNQKLVGEKDKFEYYQKEVQNLQISTHDPSKIFSKFELIVKTFFKEYYGLQQNLTFLELGDKFQKKGKTLHMKFCRLMSEIKYSGETIRNKEVKQIIEAFSKILLIK
ncbi:hypothetical protein GOV14_04945 [Candidatus Pacearchaeota archaeon]|nr:hypothetical protein [Candidatus Pacearchaeota archaeon]